MNQLKAISILLTLITTIITSQIQPGFTLYSSPKIPDNNTVYAQLTLQWLKHTRRLYSKTIKSYTTSRINSHEIEKILAISDTISEDITGILWIIDQLPIQENNGHHNQRLKYLQKTTTKLKKDNSDFVINVRKDLQSQTMQPNNNR